MSKQVKENMLKKKDENAFKKTMESKQKELEQ